MTAQAAKPSRSRRSNAPYYHRLLKDCSPPAAHGFLHGIGAGLALDPTRSEGPGGCRSAGRPRIGYAVTDVVDQLVQFLGWKKVNEAFLVGAGSLGSALLGYRKFEECGLKIVAAFDADPARVGRRIHGTHVLALPKLPGLARRMHVLIGIITVPAEAAQAWADCS